MQKFFGTLFDAAYNIFLYIDKKDRRSHLKMQGLRRSFLHENPYKIYRRGERTRDIIRLGKRTPRKRFAAVNGGAWLDFGSRKTRGRWSKALKILYSITAFL